MSTHSRLSPDGKQRCCCRSTCSPIAPTWPARRAPDDKAANKASGTRLRQALHPPLGYLGRRHALAACSSPTSAPTARLRKCRPAAAQRGHRRRRAVEAVRRRRRVRVLARRQDRVLRRAHRRQDRAVVDELRHLLGARRRLGRAEEPDRGQSGLGCASGAVARRQDAVLPGDEAPDVRGRPLRHHGARSASGATREIDPQWDRSAGDLQLSKDGKTLFTTADDNGEHPLFADRHRVSGKASEDRTGAGRPAIQRRGQRHRVRAHDAEVAADLFRVAPSGGKVAQVTQANAARLADAQMGDYEFFTFKGANDETRAGLSSSSRSTSTRRQEVSGRLHDPRRPAGRVRQRAGAIAGIRRPMPARASRWSW